VSSQATIQTALVGILKELALTREYLDGRCAGKRSQFTEEQIAFALKQADVWTPVEVECPTIGMSDDHSDNGRR
jgi:hypothetical protein